jgi:hypothetical protein
MDINTHLRVAILGRDPERGAPVDSHLFVHPGAEQNLDHRSVILGCHVEWETSHGTCGRLVGPGIEENPDHGGEKRRVPIPSGAVFVRPGVEQNLDRLRTAQPGCEPERSRPVTYVHAGVCVCKYTSTHECA